MLAGIVVEFFYVFYPSQYIFIECSELSFAEEVVEKGRWTLQEYDEMNRPTQQQEVQLLVPFAPSVVQKLYLVVPDRSYIMDKIILSETRYDDYLADSLPFVATALVDDQQRSTTNRGRITLSRTRVLEPNPKAEERFLSTAYYYDRYGR